MPHSATGGRALSILYADDMVSLAEVIGLILQEDGHRVEIAPDGDAALAEIDANPGKFDLVITDHIMPRRNGPELVRALRERQYPGKVIVFSSEVGDGATEAYDGLQVDHFLYKPVSTPKLKKILAKLCP